MKVSRIKGMKINNIKRDDLMLEIQQDILDEKIGQYISITNTEAMYFGMKNKNHYDYINNARFSLCDGVGIKIAAKFHRLQVNRYNGPELFLDIMDDGQKNNWTHFLFGAEQKVNDRLKNILEYSYPSVKILGNYSPPFRKLTKNELNEIIDNINSLKPHFLWVSLGLPKQEKWIRENIKNLNVNYCVGVGAAFDFHTNNVKRAPKILRTIGMEWFYRTLFETRLIKRQVRGFKFMLKAIADNKKSF
tara:strand:- start:1700 stop:2440 length:741 start_codon:yes stop_codon:yes gene_type:complete